MVPAASSSNTLVYPRSALRDDMQREIDDALDACQGLGFTINAEVVHRDCGHKGRIIAFNRTPAFAWVSNEEPPRVLRVDFISPSGAHYYINACLSDIDLFQGAD
jgi:hypothetical protein